MSQPEHALVVPDGLNQFLERAGNAIRKDRHVSPFAAGLRGDQTPLESATLLGLWQQLHALELVDRRVRVTARDDFEAIRAVHVNRLTKRAINMGICRQAIGTIASQENIHGIRLKVVPDRMDRKIMDAEGPAYYPAVVSTASDGVIISGMERGPINDLRLTHYAIDVVHLIHGAQMVAVEFLDEPRN